MPRKTATRIKCSFRFPAEVVKELAAASKKERRDKTEILIHAFMNRTPEKVEQPAGE